MRLTRTVVSPSSAAILRPRRAAGSLRLALLAVLRDEMLVLLVLWLGLAAPVVCQHGPMGLLLPYDHGVATTQAHAGHVAALQAPIAPADFAGHQVATGLDESMLLVISLINVVLPAALAAGLALLGTLVYLARRRPLGSTFSIPPDQPPRRLLATA